MLSRKPDITENKDVFLQFEILFSLNSSYSNYIVFHLKVYIELNCKLNVEKVRAFMSQMDFNRLCDHEIKGTSVLFLV